VIRLHFFVLVHIDSFGSTDCRFLLKDKVVLILVEDSQISHLYMPNGNSTVAQFTFSLDKK